MSVPKNKCDLRDYEWYCNHKRSSPITLRAAKEHCKEQPPGAVLSAYQAVQRVETPMSESGASAGDVAVVCVWQLRFVVLAGNFLLVFDDDKESATLSTFLYLPEALVKLCGPNEVLACGRKDVVIITPSIGLVRMLAATSDRDDTMVASITLHLETEPQQWINKLQRISSKRSLSARLQFSAPENVDQKVHLNIIDQKATASASTATSGPNSHPSGNFGARQLPVEMLQFMVSQGVTADDLDPNIDISVLESCVRIVKERDEPEVSLEALMHSGKNVNLEDYLSKEDPKTLYDIQVKIDAGMQGEVFKAIRKADNTPIAIKRVIIKNERKELPPLSNEVAFLHAARHKNVVGLHTAHKIDRNLYLAMEMMDGGKLTDLLEMDILFEEKEVATIMREVLQGLAYLHRQGCVHRDIKSDNILVNGKGELKIGDFGFAASAVSGKRKTVVGTPYWMAPEVARGEPYGFPADVWSMGIFLIELCDGLPPWMGVPPLKALVKIATLPPPEIKASRRKVSKSCHEFARLMLQKAPNKRLNCDELLQHPFVSGMNTFPNTSFLVKYLAEKDKK